MAVAMLLPAAPETASVAVGGATIEYTVVRSRRRRRTIEITVRAGEGVRVAAPHFAPGTELATLVRKRSAWILARLESLPPGLPGDPPAMALYRGDAVPFALEIGSVRSAQVTLTETGIVLTMPAARAGDPAAVRAALDAWYRVRTTEAVRETVAEWAPRLGVEPTRVIVRDQKRRWGSCAPDGALRFNWRLAMATPGLLEYVVVHELCHLRHPNHSPAFWAEVARWIPDCKARHAGLRELAASLPA